MAGFSMGGASAWPYHRALRRSLGGRRAGRGVHRDRGVPARRARSGSRRTPCSRRSGTCTTRPTTPSTRSTCRWSRTRARSTGRSRRPTRWPRRCASEGLTLEHVIGPNTGHSYEPGARQQIQDRLDQLAAKGRNPVPNEIRFTTWMLRYNKMFWIDGRRDGGALEARPGRREDRRRHDHASRRRTSRRCTSRSSRAWRRSPPAPGRGSRSTARR